MIQVQHSATNSRRWVCEVVEEYHELLCRYAYGIAQNRERANDAVQETYVRLLKQNPEKIGDHIKPWLLRVCRTRVLDIARKEGRMCLFESETMEREKSAEPEPSDRAESLDTSVLLMKYVASLSPVQREVVRLKFQAGLSYKEIGEVTHKSVNHVGVVLHQSLKRLREMLSETELKNFAEG